MNRYNHAQPCERVAGRRAQLTNSSGNELSLAMAYVPNQPFDDLFSPEDALTHGTLFRALDKPYTGNPRGYGR